MYHSKQEDTKKCENVLLLINAQKGSEDADDHDLLRCKPCARRVDHEREDSITHHIQIDLHDRMYAKHIANGAPYILAPAYQEREERRKRKAEEEKERMLGEY